MKDLTGYMTVNGKDAWTEYSAFLCEDRREDNFNFSELLKPLEMKGYTAVDFGSVTVRSCRRYCRLRVVRPGT